MITMPHTQVPVRPLLKGETQRVGSFVLYQICTLRSAAMVCRSSVQTVKVNFLATLRYDCS